MNAILIRHGLTAGNRESRYIGSRTDEPLCEEGRALLLTLHAPAVDRVYCSPMRRCQETAAILYPQHTPILVDDLRECDFGAFEGLNYHELNGRADYQAWLDSGGLLPFPGGETKASFAARCIGAFDRIRLETPDLTCAFIVHGGTIMSLMEHYARPAQDYFSWSVKNGQGYVLGEGGNWGKLFF